MDSNAKKMKFAHEIVGLDKYNIPRICKKCGGIMVFKGVGEYRCESCNECEYDDYGKVRNYLEAHRGATAAEVENETGVKQKTIRLMLKESRLEVTEDSKAFIQCEMCGKTIRYGKYCAACEVVYHRTLEEQQRKMTQKTMQGHGMGNIKGEEGEKRFKRE